MKNLIKDRDSFYHSRLKDEIIYLGDEEYSELQNMVKKQYVEAHHSREIFFLENKSLWRTYVGDPRKEVSRKKKDDLIDFLYKYYKDQELSASTILDVFNRSESYRLNTLNRSRNTIERDRQVFERFFEEGFLDRRIVEVTDEEISDYVNARSKELHLKERALKDSLQLLCRTFDFALKREKILKEKPVLRVDLQNYYQNCDSTVKSADEKIFTPEEIGAIQKRIRMEMSEKEYDPVGYAMLFSIETGVRVAEIPPLRWVDLSEKGVHIHCQQRMTRIKGKGRAYEELPFTKNERRHPKGGRYFPLTDRIMEIFDELRTKQKGLNIVSEFIFCNVDGTWMNKETYSQRLRRMCRRIGVEITNNHAFRMSLNSNVLIPAGIPVTQRAYLLGHSVETNERFYSHMRTESLIDLKELLNQSVHAESRRKEGRSVKQKYPQAP